MFGQSINSGYEMIMDLNNKHNYMYIRTTVYSHIVM